MLPEEVFVCITRRKAYTYLSRESFSLYVANPNSGVGGALKNDQRLGRQDATTIGRYGAQNVDITEGILEIRNRYYQPQPGWPNRDKDKIKAMRADIHAFLDQMFGPAQ